MYYVSALPVSLSKIWLKLTLLRRVSPPGLVQGRNYPPFPSTRYALFLLLVWSYMYEGSPLFPTSSSSRCHRRRKSRSLSPLPLHRNPWIRFVALLPLLSAFFIESLPFVLHFQLETVLRRSISRLKASETPFLSISTRLANPFSRHPPSLLSPSFDLIRFQA